MELYKTTDVLDYKPFMIVPKFLFNPPYNQLSSNAKILFVFMLDRLVSSKNSEQANGNKELYITYTREHMRQDLNVASNTTVGNALKELKSLGMITEKSSGINLPKYIYIAKIQKV